MSRCRPFPAWPMVAATAAMFAGLAAEPAHGQRTATGSDVPCAVPMSWTLGRIDPRFDLSRERALRAARDAGALWEEAVGVELFRFRVEDGHPIAFAYDERQSTVVARRERERALEAERAAMERRRLELEEASRRHEAMLEEYQRDALEHSRAVRAFNNDMLRWSRERDVPPSVQAELERRGNELDRSGRDLRDRERELSRSSDAIRDDVERFNGRVQRLADQNAALTRDFPATASESGRYEETVSLQNGSPVSVTRGIRVFQFSSYDDLVMVLAHELGHALGLGHAPGGGAVMSELVMSGADTIPSGGVTPVDTRMLAARCPDLPE